MIANVLYQFVPEFVTEKMSGTISINIRIRKDHKSKNKLSSIYLDIYQKDQKRHRIPLGVRIPIKDFDAKKQRVKPSNNFSKDYNLIIEKKLSDINNIMVVYRLRGDKLTVEKLYKELSSPSYNIDFIEFYRKNLEHQKGSSIKESTYKQQKSSLEKIKKFRSKILFHEIDKQFFIEFVKFLKVNQGNTNSTVEACTKNFKKYLKIANDQGIETPLKYSEIKNKRFNSNRVFLEEHEIQQLYRYYSNEFIPESWKQILQRFLFACFTGLRISDIQRLKTDNFVGDYLVLTMQKTDKIHRIRLSAAAKKFKPLDGTFSGKFTDQYINRCLKGICKQVGISKKITFHVSRHTFATQFLIQGGSVVNLQNLLGHSKINETMIYVHIVDSIMNEEVSFMDKILL